LPGDEEEAVGQGEEEGDSGAKPTLAQGQARQRTQEDQRLGLEQVVGPVGGDQAPGGGQQGQQGEVPPGRPTSADQRHERREIPRNSTKGEKLHERREKH
jgi:hypothetical protein